jgi:hypothetical protein
MRLVIGLKVLKTRRDQICNTNSKFHETFNSKLQICCLLLPEE